MRAEDFVSRLEKARQVANGRWMARCPAHPDKTPSLTVAEGAEGRVLVHCFSGCGIDEIVGALGLTLPDIMPEDRPLPMRGRMRLPAAEVLEAMAVNAMIVAILAHDMASGKALTEGDKDKLFAIAGEFQEALELCGATRKRDALLGQVRQCQ